MTDEVIDICEENNNLTETKKLTGEAHRDGLWHRSAHIWMYNHQNELLLQLRSPKKFLYPNVWDISVAGHVNTGETPEEAAVREIHEEIGLEVAPEELTFVKILKHQSVYKDIKNNEFYYIYLLQLDKNITELKIQTEELKTIKLITLSELERDIKAQPEKYVPHGDYWFEMIDQIRQKQTT
jgi:isopentenyldiphosphate isomerase